MLLINRRDAVQQDMVTTKEKWGWTAWKKGMLKRNLTDFFGGKAKNFFMQRFFKSSWGHFKDMPNVAQKSFSQLWKERGNTPE